MQKAWIVLASVMLVIGLSGCGKTLEQLQKIGHDLINVAGEAYKDVKDNIDEVKKAVKGEPDPGEPTPAP